MRHLLLMLMLTATLTAHTQSLGGVTLTGGVDNVVNQYKVKGWKFDSDENGSVVLLGSLGIYSNCQLFILYTKGRQVAKASVYLPVQDGWLSLKTRYTSVVEAFIGKFGKPSLQTYYFASPFREGEGDEWLALASGNVDYTSYWMGLGKANYAVSITKYKQVRLTCENGANMDVYEAEKTKSLF